MVATSSKTATWSEISASEPIGNYVVDFYAPTLRLVAEVDGSQHFEPDGAEKDKHRDRFLRGLGLRVIRFDSR